MGEPSRGDVNIFTSLTTLSPAEAIKWLKVELRTFIDLFLQLTLFASAGT